MRALPPALIALAMLAGCVSPGAVSSTEDHRLSGVFLGTAFTDELAELDLFTRTQGGEFSTSARLPPTFLATGLSGAACKALRDFASTRTYLETLGACEPVEPRSEAPAIPAPVPILVSAPIG